MADVNANIGVSIDTSDALNQLKSLQKQISQFHQSVAKSSATAASSQRDLQKNFINSVNAIQGFSAELKTVRTSAESFTNSLEKNKFSMREYFRYAAAGTKTFGKNFSAEFSTIEKTAIERVKTLQTQYVKMGRDASGAMQAIAIRPTVLNMKDLGTQTAIAAQKQVLFNQLVKQGSTNLLNFGKNTQWAGRQLMVGFTLPLATLGMTAGRVFMDMEKAAIKFKKVYGDLFTAPEETQAAMDAVTELGLSYTKYGVAVAESLDVAAEAAAAGFQGVDLQNQTSASLKLSVLGQMELQKALQTTIALQNAFRISSAELGSTIDFLNAVENQTVVSLDDITEAVPRVAPVIQALGGDVKDLAFFLAAMKEGGVNAAQGANALKSGLASLINPTERASEMLNGMGINIRAIVSENQGDLRATVVGFARALDTLDPMRRAQAIEQLFGKFQFARISALFDNVIREGSQASRVLDLAGSSLSDLAALSESELGVSAASSMNKFRSAVEQIKVALAPLGELFLDIATPFVNFGTELLKAFNNLPEGIKKIIGTVITVVGGLGPILLMTFGLINNGIANMIKFFATVRMGYLRLTGQAKGIGDETQYMTQEQLEAAAAAASLDQAHSNLTQRFTAETAAVMQLKTAYEQAGAAGARFAMLNPGMMMPGARVAKFAAGGPVGGSGNGDTVPAMLTPGEFVVNRKAAQKMLPFLEALNSGNLPGFYDGGSVKRSISEQKRQAGLYKAPSIVRNQTVDMNWSTYDAEVEAVKAAVSGLLDSTQASINKINNLVQKQASHIIPETELTQVGDRQTEIKAWKAGNLQADTGYVNNFLNSLNLSTKFLTEFEQVDLPLVAQKLNISMEEAKAELQRVKDGLHPITAQSASFVKEMGVVAQQRGSASLKYQGAAAEAGLGVRLGGNYYDTLSERSYDPSLDAKVAEQVAVKVKRLEAAMIKGVEDSTRQDSPSKEAYDAGANIGKGAINGIESQKDEALVAGEKVGQAVSTGATQSQGFSKKLSGSVSAPLMSEVALGPQTKMAAMQEKSTAAAKNQMESLNKFSMKVSGISFALSSLTGVMSMFGADLNGILPIISGITGAMFALTAATSVLTQAKFAETIATRVEVAGGFGKLLTELKGGATGLKGLGNILGRVAGAFRNMFPAISKLIVPLGIVATLFAGWQIYNKIQEEARQRIEGLGNVATLTSDKIKKLGGIFGVTPISTPLESAKPVISATGDVATDTRTMTEQVLETEAFAEDYKNEIAAISRAGKQEAELALKALAFKLSGQGFAKDQIDAIVSALVTEAKRTDVKLEMGSIDLNIQTNQDILNAQIELQMQALSNAFKTSITKTVGTLDAEIKLPGTSGMSQVVFNDLKKTMDEDLKTSIATLGGVFQSLFIGLSGQLASGQIGVDQFNLKFEELSQKILNMPEPEALLLMESVVKNLTPEMQGLVNGLGNVVDQMILIKAASAGVVITPEQVAAIEAGSKEGATSKEIGSKAIALKRVNDETTKYIKLINEGTKVSPEESLLISNDSLDLQSEKIRDQIFAYEAMVAAGIPAADAIRLIGEETLVAAIKTGGATEATMASARELLALQDQLSQITSSVSRSSGSGKKSPFQEGLDSLKEQKGEIKNNIVAYAKLRESGFRVSEALELSADSATAAALASQKFGSQNYNKLISQIRAVKQAQQELLNLTPEGRTQLFNEAYDKLSDYFSTQEALLRATSEASTETNRALIETLEEQIEGYNRQIGAFDRDLSKIAEKEDAINKEYDKKIEALEAVKKLNQDIINQQKSQLSIADALSRGDISAAASAMQEARGQSAAAQGDATRTALDAARTAELSAVTENGRTRVELESQIKALKDQIYVIEVGSLRTAQDAVVAADKALDSAISLLSYKGQTREQWEAEKLAVEAAQAQALVYEAGVHEALMTAESLVQEWGKLDRTITTTHLIETVRVESGGGSTPPPVKPPTTPPPRSGGGGGGRMMFLAKGGPVKPQYFANGGDAKGTDTVPAMLTPGEFVVNRASTKRFAPILEAINSGSFRYSTPTGPTIPGDFSQPVYNMPARDYASLGGSVGVYSASNNAPSLTSQDNSVYNYSLSVNVEGTNANANDIANVVMNKIKNIQSQQVKRQVLR